MWDDKLWIKDKGWTSVRDYIEEVPDFPIKGIAFKDISPLLADKYMFNGVVAEMGKLVDVGIHHDGKSPDYWIGIDARGFIFASALAIHCGGGVVMCRKAGKLPPTINGKTLFSYSYETEYSKDTVEMKGGSGTAVIVDDVLATGGTLQAVNHLVGMAGYDIIDNLVLIDLLYVTRTHTMMVDGAKEFDLEVKSLIQYE